jgi:hypothetical protein
MDLYLSSASEPANMRISVHQRCQLAQVTCMGCIQCDDILQQSILNFGVQMQESESETVLDATSNLVQPKDFIQQVREGSLVLLAAKLVRHGQLVNRKALRTARHMQ